MRLNFFGEQARFDHIGIGVNSIQSLVPFCESTIDPLQKVAVAFAQLHGITIELIEPQGDDSPVTESLEKGVKLLHICFAVPDIESALAECRRHGFYCIARPVPAIAFDSKKIAWVFSKDYGLVELLEEPSSH